MRALIILLHVIPLTIAAQVAQDLRVVELQAGRLTLEFTPHVHIDPIPTASGEVRWRARFLKAVDDSIGGAAFPALRVPLVVQGMQLSARLVEADFADTSGSNWADSIEVVRLDDMGFRSIAHDIAAGSRKALAPASVLDVASHSDGYLGIVALRPVVPLPTGRVRVFRRMVVEVLFDAATDPMRVVELITGPASSARRMQSLRKAFAADSPLASGDWFRVEVTEEGIYRVDRDFFTRSNITIGSTPQIRTIRIFGNGGRELSENLLDPRPEDLLEVPRYVVDQDGDGILDPDDYVLFYGASTRGWNYTVSQRTYRHFIHSYSERNVYFVTIGGATGREMDSVAALPTGSLPARGTFAEHLFVEQEKFNLVKSGRRWVGDVYDYVNSSRTYTNALPGLVTDAPVMYRYSVLSRSATVDTFVVSENDQLLGTPTLTYIVDVRSTNNEGYYAYTATVDGVSRDGNIPNSRSILKFRFGTRNQSALGWLDWFEIHYTRRLEAVSDYLRFTTADTTGGSAYVVRALTNRNVLVFDITDHRNVRRMSGIEFDAMDPTTCRFGIATVRDSVRSLIVAGNGAFKTLPAATRVANTNLRGTASAIDFIIIAPTEFLPEAERLRAHRSQRDSMNVLVAELSKVYAEFSGGVQDVMAIRDFLAFASTKWPQSPRYVLLLGGGHYDYKGISTSAPNWIPPYESTESIYQIASYASDDHFVFLSPSDRRISMRIGRLPARSLAEARLMIDRVIQYDNASPFDLWRTKVTFVADDDLTSTGSDGAIHTSQADDLATRYTPSTYEKQKIYLVEYPTVNSAVGRRKPDVNRAIIDAINSGTLIINYTGHGNERLWAHEAVFTREEDIPRLRNADRLTFLVGATCNYAQYDDPIEQSSGEYVLVLPTGGAIGVVTASRAVYSSSNAALNEYLYTYLFQRGSDGMPARLGDAMWSVKQILNGTNDLKYHLLADPTLRLAMPRISSRFDSVNGVPWPNASVVQTLGKVRIQGSVRSLDGSVRPEFSGRATVQFYDARRTVVVPQWGSYNFAVTGSSLYRGDVTVANGTFHAEIPVPKDVTIGANARLAVYAWNDTVDAVGFTELVSIAGVDSSAVIDTTGPEIDIYFDDVAFRAGDPVGREPTLIVRLRDENGINTSTVGIGHRLEATLRNPVRTLDLSQAYRSDLDTYQSGEARIVLEALPEGPNAVDVKAWDAQNNSSDASTFFVVRSSQGLVMENVLSLPNPTNGRTTFTFARASTDPVYVRVSIFAVTGRLVQTIEMAGNVDRQVLIPWDGRDADGDPVGNGLYFYRIRARDESSGETAETLGKLVMMR